MAFSLPVHLHYLLQNTSYHSYGPLSKPKCSNLIIFYLNLHAPFPKWGYIIASRMRIYSYLIEDHHTTQSAVFLIRFQYSLNLATIYIFECSDKIYHLYII